MKNVYLLLILLLSISSNAFSKQFKHLDASLSYEESKSFNGYNDT